MIPGRGGTPPERASAPCLQQWQETDGVIELPGIPPCFRHLIRHGEYACPHCDDPPCLGALSWMLLVG